MGAGWARSEAYCDKNVAMYLDHSLQMAREKRGKEEFLKLPPWQVNESHFTP